MGFWDTHDPTNYSGSEYLSTEEKDELVESGKGFAITEVAEEVGRYGEKFVVTVDLDGESRKISFTKGSIQGRDVFLGDAQAHLKNGDDPIPVVLAGWGRGYGLVAPPEDAA